MGHWFKVTDVTGCLGGGLWVWLAVERERERVQLEFIHLVELL